LLREGRFVLLDIEHIADKIESVGKSELRELANKRGWEVAIKSQQKSISYALSESPSLTLRILEPCWLGMVWTRAVTQAIFETVLDDFPGECPSTFQDELLADIWPHMMKLITYLLRWQHQPGRHAE
jgi:hypothetical protein